MCIILYKPFGLPLPNHKALKNAWTSNPDGAGIAIRTYYGEPYIVTKGLMDFPSFMEAWTTYACKDYEVIAHFRIGTSGGCKAPQTHPFDLYGITEKEETFFESEALLFHNGIFGYPSKEEDAAGFSDTMVFVRDSLTPLYYDVPSPYRIAQVIDTTCADTFSKCVFADSSLPSPMLIGEGWRHDAQTGLFWSNNGYLPATRYTWRNIEAEYATKSA